jgi:hypothetical protein
VRGNNPHGQPELQRVRGRVVVATDHRRRTPHHAMNRGGGGLGPASGETHGRHRPGRWVEGVVAPPRVRTQDGIQHRQRLAAALQFLRCRQRRHHPRRNHLGSSDALGRHPGQDIAAMTLARDLRDLRLAQR